MSDLNFHKLAELFPLLEATDHGELVSDIKENGQIEPIVLYQGEILDGRNRYRACQSLGIEPKTEEYTGPDPLKYVLSKNLHRRHLTTSQRAMIAAEIANLSHGGDRVSDQARNSTLASVTQIEAAKAMKVSADSVKKATKLKKEAAPEIVKAVKGGTMSLNAAKKATKTSKPAQSTKQKATEEKLFQRARESLESLDVTVLAHGLMKANTKEKFETSLLSIKAHLVELESMADFAEQMGDKLRHVLIDELKEIALRSAAIAQKMFGKDILH